MLVLVVFNRSTAVLWTTVALYGVFNGPALGYGYDLSTRVSPSPAASTTVAAFGITAGASIVPFVTSFAWDITGWAFFLPLFVVASHALPCMLLQDTKHLHGESSSRRPLDEDDVSVVVPTPTFGAPPSPMSGWSSTGSYYEEREDGERVREEDELDEMS